MADLILCRSDSPQMKKFGMISSAVVGGARAKVSEDLGQCANDHIADYLNALAADLVESVKIRVPVGMLGTIVEINQIHDGDSGVSERQVIVRYKLLALLKVFLQTHPARGLPNRFDHPWS